MSNLVLRLGATALALFVFASPGRAVTCEEARSLNAAELSYWAQRLEVSPPYLAALLVKAFCEVGSGPERVIVTDEKRGRGKRAFTPVLDGLRALDRANRLPDPSVAGGVVGRIVGAESQSRR